MTKTFKISRSKIELFTECPKCFYLDVVKNIKRPSMPGFSLNSAVDELLKKEFDLLRKEGKPHELMDKFGITALPYDNPELEQWRNNFNGIRYIHSNGIVFFGAVDDLWINNNGEIHVVDYKSTSTREEITLEGPYKEGYKRQIEVYQYLLEKIGYKVSKIGYFVYANANKDIEKFDSKLNFDLKIIQYEGNTAWIEKSIEAINQIINSNELPFSNQDCKYCNYIKEYNNSLNTQPTLF
jgi:hypothetical protein